MWCGVCVCVCGVCVVWCVWCGVCGVVCVCVCVCVCVSSSGVYCAAEANNIGTASMSPDLYERRCNINAGII